MKDKDRFKIADYHLSILSPKVKEVRDKLEEIQKRYLYSCGVSCIYLTPYLYIYMSDISTAPVKSKVYRIFAPEIDNFEWRYIGSPQWAEDVSPILDRLMDENHISWKHGEGYVCTNSFEDYSDELQTKLNMLKKERDQIIESIKKENKELFDEYDWWRGIWNDAMFNLTQEFAANQPFNIHVP